MKLAVGIYLLTTLIYISSICAFSAILSPSSSFSDYRAQYTGAAMIRQGYRDDFYTIEAQYKVQKSLIPVLQIKYLLPFFSPPPVAYVLSPLAFFPFAQGYIIFGMILIIAIFFTTYIAYHSVFLSKKVQELLYIGQIDILIVIALFLPLWLSVLNAQLSIVWTFIFLISYLFIKKNKQELSGFMLAFIVLKPHLLTVLVLFLVTQKQWKILRGMFIGVCILLIFSFYLIGWKGMVNYVELLIHASKNSEQYGLSLLAQPTLRGILHSVFATHLSSQLIEIMWIMGVFITVSIVLRYWRKVNNAQIFDLQWALMIIVTCFASFHTHYHDLSILLVPAVIILNYWFSILDKKNIVHREIFRYARIITIVVVLLWSEGFLYLKNFMLFFYIVAIYYLQKQIKKDFRDTNRQSLV